MQLVFLGIVFLVIVILLALKRPLYQAILGALIAADDLPDLFWVPSNAEQILLNNAGLAYDATELAKPTARICLRTPALPPRCNTPRTSSETASCTISPSAAVSAPRRPGPSWLP